MIRTEEFFDRLNRDTMHLVEEFYAPDAEFIDPVVRLKGAAEIRRYYTRLYTTVSDIRFEHGPEISGDGRSVLVWTMHLKAAMDRGRTIRLEGVSVLRRDAMGRVVYHRDYFDMGEFVYERVPLLAFLVAIAKRVLAGPFVRRP